MYKLELPSTRGTKIRAIHGPSSIFWPSFKMINMNTSTFRLPHVRIIGKNQCGEIQRTAFKCCELFQDVLCCPDYA